MSIKGNKIIVWNKYIAFNKKLSARKIFNVNCSGHIDSINANQIFNSFDLLPPDKKNYFLINIFIIVSDTWLLRVIVSPPRRFCQLWWPQSFVMQCLSPRSRFQLVPWRMQLVQWTLSARWLPRYAMLLISLIFCIVLEKPMADKIAKVSALCPKWFPSFPSLSNS